jgi:hypothetical protein
MGNLNNKTREELEDYIQRSQIQKENIEKNISKAKGILETKKDWIDTVDKPYILRNLLLILESLNMSSNCGSSGASYNILSYDLKPLCYSYRLAQLALKIAENDNEDDFFQGWEIGKIIEEIKSLKMEMDRSGVKI